MSYVFYGVITNAECAGYAFAAAFNRITVMAANYWCLICPSVLFARATPVLRLSIPSLSF